MSDSKKMDLNEIMTELRNVRDTIMASVNACSVLLRSIDERLHNVEKVMKCQKSYKSIKKPNCIPMKTVQEVQAFNGVDIDTMEHLTQYLASIGGFTLQETINLCIKEVLTNEVSTQFTWEKPNDDRFQRVAFCNTKLADAINDAVSRSTFFPPPTKVEFAQKMRTALKNAKQRNRNEEHRGLNYRRSQND